MLQMLLSTPMCGRFKKMHKP